MPYEVGQPVSIKWEEFGLHSVHGQSGILAKIDRDGAEEHSHSQNAIYYIVFQSGKGYWASTRYMKPYEREQNGTQ